MQDEMLLGVYAIVEGFKALDIALQYNRFPYNAYNGDTSRIHDALRQIESYPVSGPVSLAAKALILERIRTDMEIAELPSERRMALKKWTPRVRIL